MTTEPTLEKLNLKMLVEEFTNQLITSMNSIGQDPPAPTDKLLESIANVCRPVISIQSWQENPRRSSEVPSGTVTCVPNSKSGDGKTEKSCSLSWSTERFTHWESADPTHSFQKPIQLNIRVKADPQAVRDSSAALRAAMSVPLQWRDTDDAKRAETCSKQQCQQIDIAQQIAHVAGLLAAIRDNNDLTPISNAVQRIIHSIATGLFVGNGNGSDIAVTLNCAPTVNTDGIVHLYTISVPDLIGASGPASYIVERMWLGIAAKHLDLISDKINTWLGEPREQVLAAGPAEGGNALDKFIEIIIQPNVDLVRFRSRLEDLFVWIQEGMEATPVPTGHHAASFIHLEWNVKQNSAAFMLLFSVNQETRCMFQINLDDPNGTAKAFTDGLKLIRDTARNRLAP